MRVALKRQDFVAARAGPGAEEEMRLTRISAAELRKDPAAAADALKAQGFFPGPRVVVIEDAGDGVAKALQTALDDWQDGDATLVVTAGRLTPRGALRKLFEAHAAAYAVGIYDDPPSRDEIVAVLKAAGVGPLSPEAERDVQALAAALDPGDFRQFAEKLALYTLDAEDRIGAEDVLAVAPATLEAEVVELVYAVADRCVPDIIKALTRLDGQGEAPVRLCIALSQHFQRLYAAASDPGGPGAGLGKLRPPVFGPNRDRMARQLRDWSASPLALALDILIETDLSLRSSRPPPEMAALERGLIRIANLR